MTNIERAKEYLDLIVPSREYQKRRAMASMLGFHDIADKIKEKHKDYLFKTTASPMHAYLNTDDYAEYLERINRASKLNGARYLERIIRESKLRADYDYFNRIYVYHVGLSRDLLYQNQHTVNLIFDYKITTESFYTSFYSVGFMFNPDALDMLNPSYHKPLKDECYYDETTQAIDSRNSTLFYGAFVSMRRGCYMETKTFHLHGNDFSHERSFARLYGVERYRNGVLVSVCLKRTELDINSDFKEPNLIIYFEFDSKYDERFYKTRNVFNNGMDGHKCYLDENFTIYL